MTNPTNDMCAQRRLPLSLIRVFAVHFMGNYGPILSSCGQRRLIRLSGCSDWSLSSLGALFILLVLSCMGSNRQVIWFFSWPAIIEEFSFTVLKWIFLVILISWTEASLEISFILWLAIREEFSFIVVRWIFLVIPFSWTEASLGPSLHFLLSVWKGKLKNNWGQPFDIPGVPGLFWKKKSWLWICKKKMAQKGN